MDRERFERLVERAMENLPQEFLDSIENVDVHVEDYPTPAQLEKTGSKRRHTLLGLYEGIPQTRRGRHYGMVLPDRITIFRRAIEDRCRNDNEISTLIERVVRHEVAHHFGIDDDRLAELEGKY